MCVRVRISNSRLFTKNNTETRSHGDERWSGVGQPAHGPAPSARYARARHPGIACHTEKTSLFSPCVPVPPWLRVVLSVASGVRTEARLQLGIGSLGVVVGEGQCPLPTRGYVGIGDGGASGSARSRPRY